MFGSTVKITGERFTKESKGYKILKFILENNGASKFDCLIHIGKTGTERNPSTKKSLRGYYSVYFASLVKAGFLVRTNVDYKYAITLTGTELVQRVGSL